MKKPQIVYDALRLYLGERITSHTLISLENALLSCLREWCQGKNISTEEIAVTVSQDGSTININPANIFTQELFILMRQDEIKRRKRILDVEGVYSFRADTDFKVILNKGVVTLIFNGGSYDGGDSSDKECGITDSVFIKYGYEDDSEARIFFLKGSNEILILKSNGSKIKCPIKAEIVSDVVIEAKELGIIPFEKFHNPVEILNRKL